MSKDMYQTLGLVGQPSKFNSKLNIRYVVTIDLTATSFNPDKKNYKRVEWCFANKLHQLFSFYIAWNPFGVCLFAWLCCVTIELFRKDDVV